MVFYNKDWAEKNPKVATDFMMAWLKAARDYYDAMIGKPVRTEVINIMTRHLRVKDRALYDKMAWIFLDPNGTIIKESLREQQDWFSRHGLVPKKSDLDALVNETYLKNAWRSWDSTPARNAQDECGAIP